MTESEWLACIDPQQMLNFLQATLSKRKLRLFASACCRRLSSYFKDARSRRMVDVSELCADGLAGADALEAAFNAAGDAQEAIHWEGGDAVDQSSAEAVLGLREGLDFEQIFQGTCETAGAVTAAAAWDRIYRTPGRHWSETEREHGEAERAGAEAEQKVQAALVRDISVNPFHPTPIDPAWLTTTVTTLTQAIYDDRAFAQLPILADALEEAGCDNADILNHCRSGVDHVRGCWVIDLILGKA